MAFAVIVALLLRGKYYKRVLLLAPLNLAISLLAFLATKTSPENCNSYSQNCSLGSDIFRGFVFVSVLNIIATAAIWSLAFAKKEGTDQSNDKEGLRNILAASGAVIVFGVVAFVILFVAVVIYALTQI